KETGFTDSNWQVNGMITVANPNDWEAITANITDATNNGGSCTVTGGTGLSLPARGSVNLPYSCSYASAPSPSSGINTATGSWNADTFFTPDGSASGTAPADFTGLPTATVNKTITVTDNFNSVTTTLGTLMATDSPTFAAATYTYSRTVNVPTFNCLKFTNTAVIVETTQSASQTIEVCGPAKTGALTMGFWQNKNGQGVIQTNSGANCQNLRTWLNQFHPFSDLTATVCGSSPSLGATSGTGVAGSIYNVIKAAQLRRQPVQRRRNNMVWQRQGDAGAGQGRLRCDQQPGGFLALNPGWVRAKGKLIGGASQLRPLTFCELGRGVSDCQRERALRGADPVGVCAGREGRCEDHH